MWTALTALGILKAAEAKGREGAYLRRAGVHAAYFFACTQLCAYFLTPYFPVLLHIPPCLPSLCIFVTEYAKKGQEEKTAVAGELCDVHASTGVGIVGIGGIGGIGGTPGVVVGVVGLFALEGLIGFSFPFYPFYPYNKESHYGICRRKDRKMAVGSCCTGVLPGARERDWPR